MAFTIVELRENKEWLADEEFYVYVGALPDRRRENARVTDEIRWFLNTQDTTELMVCYDNKLHIEPGVPPAAAQSWCGNPRVNRRPCPLIYPDMTLPQLRHFVRKFESLHPKINEHIRKHFYHNPWSNSLGYLAMFTSDNLNTELKNQVKTHEFEDKEEKKDVCPILFKKIIYKTDYSAPSVSTVNLIQNQYPITNAWTDQLNAKANKLSLSNLPKRTYGRVKYEYNPEDPHGLTFNNDALMSERMAEAVKQIVKEVEFAFEDLIRLMDNFVPMISIRREGKKSIQGLGPEKGPKHLSINVHEKSGKGKTLEDSSEDTAKADMGSKINSSANGMLVLDKMPIDIAEEECAMRLMYPELYPIETIPTETDLLGNKHNSKKIPNRILYAYIFRFLDDNIEGKYMQY